MWASLTGGLIPIRALWRSTSSSVIRPHTVVPDTLGNIWYTGNSNATVGKLNPATGEVTEYKTEARDPHSAVFHPNGNLYFTAQGAAMLGRLDPDTGDLTEIPVEPSPTVSK